MVWNSGFDYESTSSPGAVAGMYGVGNLKSSQFDVWFSCKVRLWDKTDIYSPLDQCYKEAFFML